jgi:hypothetical protein
MALSTFGRSVHQAISQTSESIHTTLYDLMSAVIDSVEPYSEELITAVVIHLLNSHRVMGAGDLRGYRLVCAAEAAPCRSIYQSTEQQRAAG